MKQMFMTVGTTVNRQRDQLLRVGRITNHHDIHFGTCVGLLYRTNAHTTKLEKKNLHRHSPQKIRLSRYV